MTTPQPLHTRHPLEDLRIKRDWSYRRLAEVILDVTGVRRTEAAWSRICQRLAVPSRRTQYAIDQFLDAQRDKPARRQAVSR